MHLVATILFVAGALATIVLSSVGAAIVRGPLDRLHFLSLASLAAPVLLAAGWSCEGGDLGATAKCWLTALVLIVQAPVLTHVAAHAEWRRRRLKPAPKPEGTNP
ncbi:MAG TPA: monovalent cation/H(+) antiporter subunit G [Pirellulales bacterium]|jgi:multisubunit Na+/H+ antiporter MnhG subunit|nr:monovalent cation/H(+) antiporter subunit G [Pirellulales bacterium]